MIKKETTEVRFQSALLTLITAIVIGCFSFLWQMNKDFAALQERDRQRAIDINSLQMSLNKAQGDIQDLNVRTTKMEVKQNSKQ